VIIFGLMRRFTILGIKLDACTSCGRECDHVVGRKTRWGHIFWAPVLFLGWEHGMLCSSCGAWTGIPWRQVRAAMKSGELRLDRPHGFLHDRFMVNPKRGAFDLYTKAWPLLAVGVLVLVGLSSALKAGPSDGGRAIPAASAAPTVRATPRPPAHVCWEAADGTLNGCRLSSGSIVGSATGSMVTCFFFDSDLETSGTVSCSQ